MKILKIYLNKKREPQQTSFNYPDKWDAEKLNVIAYEDSDNMGTVREYCLAITMDDEYADELIASTKDVEEIDEKTANRLGKQCKPDKLILNSAVDAELILAANKPYSEQSTQERAMLDPDNDEPGINRKVFNIKDYLPGE